MTNLKSAISNASLLSKNLRTSRGAVTEGSQGQARSAAAPGYLKVVQRALKGRQTFTQAINNAGRSCVVNLDTTQNNRYDRNLSFLPPFQGLMVLALDPGAAALRACPWLPSFAPSVLFV